MKLTFCCVEKNDVFKTLAELGHPFPRYEDMNLALEHASEGTGVLIMADRYPRLERYLDDHQLMMISKKQLRVYVEYPERIPGIEMGLPREAKWERGVVTSSLFSPELDIHSIVELHGCWFLPAQTSRLVSHLSLARIAGYDQAVFGLPEETYPLLFELPSANIIIGASKLSQFITGRYGPAKAWKKIWQALLQWLDPEGVVPDLVWRPDVKVRFGEHDMLPDEIESVALEKSFQWFDHHVLHNTDKGKGALEGYVSHIDHQGRQIRRAEATRADCTAESAIVFAYDWSLKRNPASRETAIQMMDYVWSAPAFVQNDKESPAYGLVNWFDRAPIFYSDDNARVIISSMLVSRLLDDGRWDEDLLRCILANWRTSGAQGFRHHFLRYPGSFSENLGWEFYKKENLIRYSPHHQAYLWACYIWAYALTGFEPLLETAKQALSMTMAAYPGEWKWTNGMTQEISRMLLPLSFLVRVEDTAEHRSWLNQMSEALLEHQHASGAIAEQIGRLENGIYPPPQSNEAYGTGEAALLQRNGDPVCDLLYTTNFAFLGFHEAVVVEPKFKRIEDRLAEFLCRIQLSSEKQSYLDGAWMRSFDYKKWEYWGSSSDLGWGAWCIETGWTNAWIAAVLAMRQAEHSLFDLSLAKRWKSLLPNILDELHLKNV